jgi:signal transduction histidine kinase
MSREARFGLLVARYGSYLFLFMSHAVGRRRLPMDRLELLAVLLLGLVGLAALVRRPLTRPQKVGLIAVELALTFAAGFLIPESAFFLLYFIALVDIFFCFPLGQAIAVMTLAYALLGINIASVWAPWSAAYIQTMGSILLGFIFTAAAVHFAVEQRKAREQAEHLLKELGAAHAQLQAYAVEVETLSVARERQRLAREVHDAVAHVLTGLLVQTQAIRKLLRTEPAAAAARLVTIEDAARRGLDEVRRAVRAMRPEHLEGVGGVEAMQRLCEQFAERTGMRVSFLTDTNRPLAPAQDVLLYRTLQECLTNAARHGRASTVWAQLSTKDDRIELRVRDDGVGGQDVRPGMGMGGMQERAQAAGGQFRYATAPNAGFETVLELPYAGVQAAAG